jgi:hypothetical protein
MVCSIVSTNLRQNLDNTHASAQLEHHLIDCGGAGFREPRSALLFMVAAGRTGTTSTTGTTGTTSADQLSDTLYIEVCESSHCCDP